MEVITTGANRKKNIILPVDILRLKFIIQVNVIGNANYMKVQEAIVIATGDFSIENIY